jgi:hypothetical protein
MFGGWLGNLASCFNAGHGCVEWQTNLVDEINRVLKNYEKPCFTAFGVATSYPFFGKTKHNWVRIFGCQADFNEENVLHGDSGVDIDPWPTGGESLFGDKNRPADIIRYCP